MGKRRYHLRDIPKGKVGEFSKIEEEVAEARDAIDQKCRVMLLVEMCDILGAIDAFLVKEFNGTFALQDLVCMSRITKRAMTPIEEDEET